MKPLLARIDRLQQRRPSLGIPVAVSKRFGEHGGSRLAATISYFSFFSVFPLLLALVTVLNIVLKDDPELRSDLLDGALGQIPVIGTQLADDDAALGGSVIALVVGLAAAVWAGLGAVNAIQQALDELGDVPVHDRPSFVVKKLKAVAFLVALAVGLSAATLLSSLRSLFDLGIAAGLVGIAATVAVNVAVLLMTYSVLPARRRPLRELLPGALVGAVALALLLQLGTWVVTRYIAGASDTYGTFAIVIALLSWFHLVSRVILMAAELNDVVASHLWPRSMVAGAALTEADRQATLLDMQRVQRDERFGFALAVGDDVVGTNGADDATTAASVGVATQPETSR